MILITTLPQQYMKNVQNFFKVYEGLDSTLNFLKMLLDHDNEVFWSEGQAANIKRAVNILQNLKEISEADL